MRLEEQETTISFSRDSDVGCMWTSDRTMITKMKKLCEKNPDDYKLTDVQKNAEGEVLAITFMFPSKLLSFRSRIMKRNISDSDREQMRKRALNNLHK